MSRLSPKMEKLLRDAERPIEEVNEIRHAQYVISSSKFLANFAFLWVLYDAFQTSRYLIYGEYWIAGAFFVFFLLMLSIQIQANLKMIQFKHYKKHIEVGGQDGKRT